jgi:FecR-like protein
MSKPYLSVRRASIWYLTVIMAAVGLLVGASGTHSQTPVGSITAINGTVTITRGTTSIPAAFNTVVDVGDRIVTAADGRATITLPDTTQIEIAESSTLVLTENIVNPNGTRASTRVTLLGGLATSLVRFSAGTPPNFEVHTPNAVASARGTYYPVQYTKGTAREGYKDCTEFTDVSVYDGTVEVSNPTNPSAPPVEVHAGEKTTVPCGLGPLPTTAISGGLGAAGMALGTAVVVGGVVGGVAAAGGFGGGGGATPTPTPFPISPGQ